MSYSFDDVNHFHKLDNKHLIGTSTVCSEGIPKQGALTWWSSGKACEVFGWLNPKKYPASECFETAEKTLKEIKNLDVNSYVKLLQSAYCNHKSDLKKTAKQGTDLHAMAEEYIKSKINKIPLLFDNEEIKTFVDWCEKNVKEFLFSEVHVYSQKHWIGGIVDFAYIDLSGDMVVADIKSGGVHLGAFAQIAGYQIQLEENNMSAYDMNGNLVYHRDIPVKKHAVFSFKDGFKEPVIRTTIDWHKEVFLTALAMHKNLSKWEEANG